MTLWSNNVVFWHFMVIEKSTAITFSFLLFEPFEIFVQLNRDLSSDGGAAQVKLKTHK